MQCDVRHDGRVAVLGRRCEVDVLGCAVQELAVDELLVVAAGGDRGRQVPRIPVGGLHEGRDPGEPGCARPRQHLPGLGVVHRPEVAVGPLPAGDRVQVGADRGLPLRVRVEALGPDEEQRRLGEGARVQPPFQLGPALRPAVLAVPDPPEGSGWGQLGGDEVDDAAGRIPLVGAAGAHPVRQQGVGPRHAAHPADVHGLPVDAQAVASAHLAVEADGLEQHARIRVVVPAQEPFGREVGGLPDVHPRGEGRLRGGLGVEGAEEGRVRVAVRLQFEGPQLEGDGLSGLEPVARGVGGPRMRIPVVGDRRLPVGEAHPDPRLAGGRVVGEAQPGQPESGGLGGGERDTAGARCGPDEDRRRRGAVGAELPRVADQGLVVLGGVRRRSGSAGRRACSPADGSPRRRRPG